MNGKALLCMGMLSLVLAGLTGCASLNGKGAQWDQDAPSLSGARRLVLTVHGLSCPLCANNLDGQLKRLDGVDEATINLETGAVTVQLRETHALTAADLADAVRDAGFTLQALQVDNATP